MGHPIYELVHAVAEYVVCMLETLSALTHQINVITSIDISIRSIESAVLGA